jgi:hypothetical protein
VRTGTRLAHGARSESRVRQASAEGNIRQHLTEVGELGRIEVVNDARPHAVEVRRVGTLEASESLFGDPDVDTATIVLGTFLFDESLEGELVTSLVTRLPDR